MRAGWHCRRAFQKKKETDAARPEPPAEVVIEALKLFRADRTGRWHVRAPEGTRHRNGPYAWSISNREAERLLRLLWPTYVASRQRLADRSHGGEVSRVPASWRYALEAALDREVEARRAFARRRDKWEQQRRQSEELRRRQMPPEQRRELERKERDIRMRAINADLDKRGRGHATRTMMEARSHIRRGRLDRIQGLLTGIAGMPEGVAASEIALLVVPREAHLLPPADRDRWGREIVVALAERGFLVEQMPDCYTINIHAAGPVDAAGGPRPTNVTSDERTSARV
jgi:hypothetical protein